MDWWPGPKGTKKIGKDNKQLQKIIFTGSNSNSYSNSNSNRTLSNIAATDNLQLATKKRNKKCKQPLIVGLAIEAQNHLEYFTPLATY